MPGLGRKTFIATEVLTAANINGYLMDQSVMKYANTAAASSAVGTAISEGMQFYLSDTDEQVFYNGSSFAKQNGTTNAIINGAFDIWQRGTSFTNPGNLTFTADRIGIYFDGTGATRTVSQQANTAIIGASAPSYFIRFDHSVAGTGAANNLWYHRIENVGTFAGQTVTFSIYAKAAATTIMPKISIDQNFGTGGSATVTTDFATSISVGTSWTRYSYTVTLPSISGKTIGAGNYLGIEVRMPLNATFTLDFSQIQLEAGSVATPFKRNSASIQAEVAACQRYFQIITSGAGFTTRSGNSTIADGTIALPVQMRAIPSASASAALKLDNAGVSNYTQSAPAVSVGGSANGQYFLTALSNFSGLPTPGVFLALRNDGGSILLSSEL